MQHFWFSKSFRLSAYHLRTAATLNNGGGERGVLNWQGPRFTVFFIRESLISASSEAISFSVKTWLTHLSKIIKKIFVRFWTFVFKCFSFIVSNYHTLKQCIILLPESHCYRIFLPPVKRKAYCFIIYSLPHILKPNDGSVCMY